MKINYILSKKKSNIYFQNILAKKLKASMKLIWIIVLAIMGICLRQLDNQLLDLTINLYRKTKIAIIKTILLAKSNPFKIKSKQTQTRRLNQPIKK
jgi:hypothetical protein